MSSGRRWQLLQVFDNDLASQVENDDKATRLHVPSPEYPQVISDFPQKELTLSFASVRRKPVGELIFSVLSAGTGRLAF